jgi:hypothetical protein
MATVRTAWASLAATSPALPWVLIPTLAWLITWAVRTFYPTAWQRFADAGPVGAAASKSWQSLPVTVIGTAIGAVTAGLDPTDLCLAALASLLAPVWHEALHFVTARVPWLPTYFGGAFPAAGSAPRPEVPAVPRSEAPTEPEL